jgi:hypothetical protein
VKEAEMLPGNKHDRRVAAALYTWLQIIKTQDTSKSIEYQDL